jgi:hypothetical protein
MGGALEDEGPGAATPFDRPQGRRWLRPVSPTLLLSGCGFKPHLLHRFLIFY